MAGSAERGQVAGRPMKSDVNWLLLSLVIERASYGHELYQRYERTYGTVWPISKSSHVYSALDALEARCLIEKIEVDADGGRQPRLRYRATPAGVRSYEKWVVKLIDIERRRHELLARQLGILARAPAVGLHVLELLERRCLEGAGQVGACAGHPPGSRDELIDDLVNERLRLAVGGTLSWLRHATERFEELKASQTPDELA